MSVSPTRGPFQRPSVDRDLAELFQRVEDLERVKRSGLPLKRELLGGVGVTIADGATALLTWDITFGPDTILDRTNPTNPVLLFDGVFAININVVPATPLTAGGGYDGYVNAASLPMYFSAAASYGPLQPATGRTWVGRAEETGVVQVSVTNHDGASSRGFALGNVFIQQLAA